MGDHAKLSVHAKAFVAICHNGQAIGIASSANRAHLGPMTAPSPLDNPRNAVHAWAHYRRLLKWMLLASVLTAATAMAYLYRAVGMVSIHYFIAAFLGVMLTMMLTAALMGLMFLSSGTGHDESIEDPLKDLHDW